MKLRWLIMAWLCLATTVTTTLSQPVDDRESYPEETVEAEAEESQPAVAESKELKAEASHQHGGRGASGHLDMGAYSSHHGAFGWYADFPVGHAH